MKLAVLIPTPTEAAPLAELLRGGKDPADGERSDSRRALTVTVCGVGPVAAAAATAKVVSSQRPDALVLAGIAGAYPESGLETGICVSVTTEYTADVGAVRDGRFTPLAQPSAAECAAWSGLYVPRRAYRLGSVPGRPFPEAASNTVSCCATAWLERAARPAAAVENMEGAAVAAVCEALGTPCFELRAVSNITGARPADWRTHEASRTLAEAVLRLAEILVSGPLPAPPHDENAAR